MATNRNLVFLDNHIYHVYNRGVERRQLFINKREYARFVQTIDYYRHVKPQIRFSKFLSLNTTDRELFEHKLAKLPTYVDILAYCLMPNHFHFLLRQNVEHGIQIFLSNVSNSYAKYFNTKHVRVGPLFQAAFKANFIETDEELIHVSRYIHINPAAASMVSAEQLTSYPWSSLGSYRLPQKKSFIEIQTVLGLFPSPKAYEQFILDQIDYAKNLEKIKHLRFEE